MWASLASWIPQAQDEEQSAVSTSPYTSVWPEKNKREEQGKALLSRNWYRVLNVLGSGSYGTVYRAQRLDTMELVAVKVLDFNSDENIRELHVQHAAAKHLPGLLTANRFGFDKETSLAFIELPLAKGGSLYDYISERLPRATLVSTSQRAGSHVKDVINSLSLSSVVRQDDKFYITSYELLALVHNILCGLSALHRVNIVHLDLKPDNILLMERNQNAVLSDFGMASNVSSAHFRLGQESFTDPWRPIEYYYDGDTKPTQQGDIWSFGIILIEILTACLYGYGQWNIFPFDITDSKRSNRGKAILLADWQNVSAVELKQQLTQPLRTCSSANVLHMLNKTASFLKLKPVRGWIHPQVRNTLALFAEMASQCLRISPQCRPSAQSLMDQVTQFMYTTESLLYPTCIIPREKNLFAQYADDTSAALNKNSSLNLYEMYFRNALLKYEQSKDSKKHAGQVNWIMKQSGDLIKKWKVNPTGLDAMLVRVLTTMLFWGNGDYSFLWLQDSEKTREVDPKLKAFLKDSQISALSGNKITSFTALIKALRPWIEKLEDTSVQEKSNMYSIPAIPVPPPQPSDLMLRAAKFYSLQNPRIPLR